MGNKTQIMFLFYLVLPLSVISAAPNSYMSLSVPPESEAAFTDLVSNTKVRFVEVKVNLTGSKSTESETVTQENYTQLDSLDVPKSLKWVRHHNEPLLAFNGFTLSDMTVYSLGTLFRSMARLTVPFNFKEHLTDDEFELDANGDTNKPTSRGFAHAVLVDVAKLKGTVCYPEQDSYRCCKARNAGHTCDLEVDNNHWLTMYLYMSLGWPSLASCILFAFCAKVPDLASGWFHSIQKTQRPEGKRLLEPDNNSPIGLGSIISKHVVPEANDSSPLGKLKRFFLSVLVLPLPVHLLIVVGWVLGELSSFWEGNGLLFCLFYILYYPFALYLSFCTWSSPSANSRNTVVEDQEIQIFGKFCREAYLFLLYNPLTPLRGVKWLCVRLLLGLCALFVCCIYFCILFFNLTAVKQKLVIIISSAIFIFFCVFILQCIILIITFTVLGIVVNLVDFLPYILFAMLAIFYFWDGYNLYTEKFITLKLHLFKLCQKLNQGRVKDSDEDTMNEALVYYDGQHIPGIPEKLFDIACREILPKSEVAYVMIIKLAAKLFFLFVIFLATMAFAQQMEVDSIVQAFMAIITGSLLKVISLFSRKATAKEFEELRLNSRLQDIVKRFAQGEF